MYAWLLGKIKGVFNVEDHGDNKMLGNDRVDEFEDNEKDLSVMFEIHPTNLSVITNIHNIIKWSHEEAMREGSQTSHCSRSNDKNLKGHWKNLLEQGSWPLKEYDHAVIKYTHSRVEIKTKLT